MAKTRRRRRQHRTRRRRTRRRRRQRRGGKSLRKRLAHNTRWARYPVLDAADTIRKTPRRIYKGIRNRVNRISDAKKNWSQKRRTKKQALKDDKERDRRLSILTAQGGLDPRKESSGVWHTSPRHK